MCINTPKLNSRFFIMDKEGYELFYGRLVSLSSSKGEVWIHVKRGKKKNVYRTTVSAISRTSNRYVESYEVLEPELWKGNH